MNLLALALARQLWLDGSGLVALALGATRTGLHLILWVQPGQGYTRYRGRNTDRGAPDYVGATRTGIHPISWAQLGQGYTQFHGWELYLEQ